MSFGGIPPMNGVHVNPCLSTWKSDKSDSGRAVEAGMKRAGRLRQAEPRSAFEVRLG